MSSSAPIKSQVRRLLVSYEAANAGSSPTTAVARDAALGGLFIETTAPFPIGTLLTVELTSPKSESVKVTLEGRVFSMRAAPEGPERPAGMGVRFLDLPAGMMVKLQSILDHHRPPARTQLGVGDEKEALWQAAGGRDDLAPKPTDQEDSAVALAAAVVVDGRPTFDPLPPAPPPGFSSGSAPEEPRHPTPRMMRAVPPAPASSQPSSLSAQMLPATPPSISPASYQPPPRKLGAMIAIVIAIILIFLALAAGAGFVLLRRGRAS